MPRPEPKRRFTVVFEGELAEISGNPFHVLSRFGKPVAIAVGDALDTLDRQEMTRSQKAQKLIDERLSTLRRA